MKVVPCKHCHGTGQMIEDELIATNDERMKAWFDSFWRIYWRKKAKGTAWKAWIRHVSNESIFDQIMEAVRSQEWEMRNRKAEHIPYPASWLNSLQWQDQPTVKAQPRVIACELCGDSGLLSVVSGGRVTARYTRCSCARGALPGLVIPQEEETPF